MDDVSGASAQIEDCEDAVMDDGIAMALLDATRDLADVKDRIETLVNTHARRQGVTVAA